MLDSDKLNNVLNLLENSKHTTVFTGAGISVESGIPPFRGENGLWNKYDPDRFTLQEFMNNPRESWELNKKVFYDMFKNKNPNQAHEILAKWEDEGLVNAVITQNIDGLHQKAGSETIFKFHGTSQELICTECSRIISFNESQLNDLPPRCEECNGILKPNYVFFGEGIPREEHENSLAEVEKADLFIIIGTTGEVMPACRIPLLASREGANIIEVNTDKTNFTSRITDIFLQGKATDILKKLDSNIRSDKNG